MAIRSFSGTSPLRGRFADGGIPRQDWQDGFHNDDERDRTRVRCAQALLAMRSGPANPRHHRCSTLGPPRGRLGGFLPRAGGGVAPVDRGSKGGRERLERVDDSLVTRVCLARRLDRAHGRGHSVHQIAFRWAALIVERGCQGMQRHAPQRT